MIRMLLVALLFLIFFITFFPVMAVLWLLRKKKPELVSRVSFRIIKCFLKVELFVSGTKVIVSGQENIPGPGEPAVLYVGNHRSDYDVLVAYSRFKCPTGFIAKKSLRSIPVMGCWMELIDSLFLDRENAREGLKTIKEAIGNIKAGKSVFIFPEGTRNKNDDCDIPMRFKEGSLKIAQKSGCRIVPVAIKDTEKIFEVHKPFITAETVRIRFCDPISMDEIPEEFRKEPGEYIRRLIMEVNRTPQP